MDDLLPFMNNYSRICRELKAHKRAALNIKDQLSSITNAEAVTKSGGIPDLCASVAKATSNLERLAQLTVLQTYIQQGEITEHLDDLSNACWNAVRGSDDDILLEEIETNREIYESDRKVDAVNIKRLLRECLRQEDIHEQVLELPEHEFFSFKSALQLEISIGKGRSDATQLYQDFLVQIEPLWSGKAHVLQDLTGQIVRTSEAPIAWGAACAVWLGELYSKKVVLHASHKQFRPKDEDISILKSSITWAKFDHQNILKLIGIYRHFRDYGMALVSPYMSNGTALEFLRTNTGADKLRIISDIAAGLTYLHSRQPPYIHGLLAGNSVMIDDNHNAVICGFATPTFEQGQWRTSLRWLAPEFLMHDTDSYYKSIPGDVYSFAMTAYELVTMQIPFGEHRNPREVIEMVERGEHPAFGEGRLVHRGVDGQLRLLISSCWVHDPDARPTMHDIHIQLEKMRETPILDVKDLTDRIKLLDDIQSIHASGGFGDIRRAILDGFGPVALKTLVIRGKTQPILRLTKRFMREAYIWGDLDHPNILPFLGTADPPGLSTCLVSPWLYYGNCIQYLEKYPEIPPLPIAYGVTEGLRYLHSHQPPVIHGDLRGANVLINNSGQPLLSDFGLAVIVEDLTQMPISSALEGSGNPRWMAPELFLGQEIVSKASDVWSLGMFYLEIITLDVPFRDLKTYPQVILAIHQRRKPERPTSTRDVTRGLTDELWDLMQRCWAPEKGERPSAAEVLAELYAIIDDKGQPQMEVDI